ncbi:MAG TPA: hypothetical protein VGR35_11825 [Tepidisphaeraceae bacterium]|nr:hypothetical protein [Tepidisphaeraceae bacterium]
MSWQPAAAMCVSAANRRIRSVRERLFPPTWVAALTEIKAARAGPKPFTANPSDLLYDLLIATPGSMNSDDPEEDFRVWFFHRHDFGKLLCLYEAMSHVAVRLNLSEPTEPDFDASFECRGVSVARREAHRINHYRRCAR